jgi:hypothetical protein
MRKHLGVVTGLFLLPSVGYADAPPFDRPGISFSPAVLAPGAFDWEQGLPDVQRDYTGGVRSTSYSADTTFRLGLAQNFEAQVTGSLWNRLDVRIDAVTSRMEGAGDTRLSLKWAPTLPIDHVSLAILGGITFDTGSATFTNGRRIYSLGAVVGKDLGAGRSVAAYANVDRSGGLNTWTLSTNYGFPIHGNFGAYVEAGRMFGNGASNTFGGAGLTWLWHDRLQLDLYGRRGLTPRSPDLQAGFGVSLFWK